jgi:hypothetical protein
MARSSGRIGLALTAVALLAVGFAGGRMLSPSSTFDLAPLRDDPLEQAWDDFIRAQQETIALFRASPFFEDDQERAEAYRGALYALVGSIRGGALVDPDHPRFVRAVDWSSKSGLDNPDNNYYTAIIRDDADYRISGARGTSRNLVFQLLVGQPGVRGAGTSTNVSVLYDHDMQVADDGSFEIIVSRSAPASGVNWLPNGDGAQTLLVRFTHSDWEAEAAGELRIEEIGAEGESAAPLTPTQMALGLREAAVSLFDRTATWMQFSERLWNLMPRNAVSAPRTTQGGLVGQYSAFGSWELNNNQVIVLSTAPSKASYQGIELGNLWFVSLDYETRTSSLTLDQLQCSNDGRCYTVISHRDPGIPNWLDTGGHRRGLIMMRWQGLDAALPEAVHPRAQLVDFADLREYLPADTPHISGQQRAAMIRERRMSVQRRFDG